MKLRVGSKLCLWEAMRRMVMKPENDLDSCLLGLGSKTMYQASLDQKLMEYSFGPNPGCLTWFRLTKKGKDTIVRLLFLGHRPVDCYDDICKIPDTFHLKG